ncbi:Uncharacterised protein [uncultured archaeon]|nr:Uncharacterised protein [uncultured archaeon]
MRIQLMLFAVLVVALLSHQAFAGCGKWVIRETTDYLDDPTFDEAIKSSTGPDATVNADGSPIIKSNASDAKPEAAQNGQTEATAKASPAIDLSGKWQLRLVKEHQEQKKAFDLILIQSGNRLQGYGTVIVNGQDSPATATGSVSQDAVNLQIELREQKKNYRMDLALINKALQGSYELYEADKLAEKGNATAGRS